MHNPGNLRAIQHAARVQRQQHRSRRLLLFTEKTVLVRHGQVHTGVLHGRQAQNGAGQLPFQRALVIHAFLKLGDAELARLHDLKARHRALGQALRCQLQTHIVHAVGRNHDRATTFGVLVRHVHGRQLRHDGATILVAQIAEQHAIVWLAAEHQRCHDAGHHQGHHTAQHDALIAVEAGGPLLPCSGTCGGGRLFNRNFSNCRHVFFQMGAWARHGAQRVADYSNFPSGRSPDKAPVSPLIHADARFAIAYDCTHRTSKHVQEKTPWISDFTTPHLR